MLVLTKPRIALKTKVKRKTFKLYPTKEQEEILYSWCGACRFVYNYYLSKCQTSYKKRGMVDFKFLQNNLPWLKTQENLKVNGKEVNCTFLQEVPAIALQAVSVNLKKAYLQFYRKLKEGLSIEEAGLPKFKRKFKCKNSLRVTGEGKIRLSKTHLNISRNLGDLKIHKCDINLSKVKDVTIYEDCGIWYASISVEFTPAKLFKTNKEVGIDLGVKRLYTRNDGKFRKALDLTKEENKLNSLQQQMSKQTLKSKRWLKTKAKFCKLWKKVRNKRKDYNHKASKYLVTNYDKIVIEDLQIKKMTKSAKGTLDKPGKNVEKKKKLNKIVLGSSLGQFRQFLAYKADWYSKTLIKVNPKNTSRKCSCCGFTSKENRKTQADFICQSCGLKINADNNAAINILRLGTSQGRTLKGNAKPLQF